MGIRGRSSIFEIVLISKINSHKSHFATGCYLPLADYGHSPAGTLAGLFFKLSQRHFPPPFLRKLFHKNRTTSIYLLHNLINRNHGLHRRRQVGHQHNSTSGCEFPRLLFSRPLLPLHQLLSKLFRGKQRAQKPLNRANSSSNRSMLPSRRTPAILALLCKCANMPGDETG